MTYRIPLQDLSSSDDAQFGCKWEARVPVPITEIDADPGGAFHCQYASLGAGDQVTVCAFDPDSSDWRDRGKTRLREIAIYRIVSRGERQVEAMRIGEIVTVAGPKAPPREDPGEVQSRFVIAEVGTNFEVRDAAGNVIEQFAERGQAEQFMAREEGRGLKGVTGLSVKRAFGGKFNVIDSAGDIVAADFPTKAAAETYIAGGGRRAA